MTVCFGSSYVDKLFVERDMLGLHHLISVVAAERQLSEPFWLFCRLLEWSGSARSGVWQYYETLPEAMLVRMSRALDQAGLPEIALKFQLGRDSWNGSDKAADLDAWLDANEQQIHCAAFELIATRKNELYCET